MPGSLELEGSHLQGSWSGSLDTLHSLDNSKPLCSGRQAQGGLWPQSLLTHRETGILIPEMLELQRSPAPGISRELGSPAPPIRVLFHTLSDLQSPGFCMSISKAESLGLHTISMLRNNPTVFLSGHRQVWERDHPAGSPAPGRVPHHRCEYSLHVRWSEC